MKQIAEVDAEMHARWMSMSMQYVGAVHACIHMCPMHPIFVWHQVLRVWATGSNCTGCAGCRFLALLQRPVHDHNSQLMRRPTHVIPADNIAVLHMFTTWSIAKEL